MKKAVEAMYCKSGSESTSNRKALSELYLSSFYARSSVAFHLEIEVLIIVDF